MFQINLHKVQHWKCFQLENTDFNNHVDQTPSVETIPYQTAKPQTCRDCKCFR